MKLLRFKDEKNNIKTGYFDGEKVIELKKDILTYFNLDLENLKNEMTKSYSLNEINIINPVSPSKIVCIGLNYKDHAKEMNLELPKEPRLFIKPSTSIIGPEDKIIYPKISKRVDYEAELAVVIGKKTKNIQIKDAQKSIFGYTIINDVTARDITIKDEQWTRGKSFDTFAPIGPFIETNLNPLNQNIKLFLNNKLKQNSNTKNMIFSPFKLVNYISNVMTLNPGDIIATGTPPGVSSMNKGDCIKIEIENIGILTNYLI
jgi:2-keto-4-pentenoate hydratase/2-oxohepta-3-ene-1,7-dioic acid hydratase in catechol pathway